MIVYVGKPVREPASREPEFSYMVGRGPAPGRVDLAERVRVPTDDQKTAWRHQKRYIALHADELHPDARPGEHIAVPYNVPDPPLRPRPDWTDA